MRRWASAPSGSAAGSSGGWQGHQIATGESGSSSGSTTDSACLTTSPRSRISAVSPDQPAPVPTWALICAAPRPSPRITPSTRAGCSWEAARAACMALSASSSSTTMINVITIPIAGEPARDRARVNSAAIWDALVSMSSIISGPPPGPAVPGEHGVGRRRPTRPGVVLLGLALAVRVLLGPVLEDRVEDLPGELDLLVAREQRRVAEQDVEDQPLVGLRGGLGERAAVDEVHVDVADLHLGAGHLGAEPERHALVGLHPDHQGVLGELLDRRLREGQVRRALE